MRGEARFGTFGVRAEINLSKGTLEYLRCKRCSLDLIRTVGTARPVVSAGRASTKRKETAQSGWSWKKRDRLEEKDRSVFSPVDRDCLASSSLTKSRIELLEEIGWKSLGKRMKEVSEGVEVGTPDCGSTVEEKNAEGPVGRRERMMGCSGLAEVLSITRRLLTEKPALIVLDSDLLVKNLTVSEFACVCSSTTGSYLGSEGGGA